MKANVQNRRRNRDGLSPFRYFMNSIRRRNRAAGLKDEITIQDLCEQWASQTGVCPYTGITLVLPEDANGFTSDIGRLHRASVDRIDSSVGYEPGNIQFISQMANYAKNDAPHGEMESFCEAVSRHWST